MGFLEYKGAGVVISEHTPKYTQKYTPKVLRAWLQMVYEA